MPWILIGLVLTLGFMLAARWVLRADPRVVAEAARRVIGAVAIALGLLLSVRGAALIGGPILMAGVGALAPGLLPRLFPGGFPGRRGRASVGRRSTIATGALRMTLDHDTGALDGEAIAGPFAGRRLSEIALDALETWLTDLSAHDPDSAALLDAYLERRGRSSHGRSGPGPSGPGPSGPGPSGPGPSGPGPSGQGQGGQGSAQPGGGGPMSEAEAYAVLGLTKGASADDVRAAHRRLMLQAHPDRGGSTWLAAKVNEAKAIILKSLGEAGR